MWESVLAEENISICFGEGVEKSIFHVNSVNLFNDDKLLVRAKRSSKKQFEMHEFRKK